MLIEAFARMLFTPSGFGGRRRNDGNSPFVTRRGRVGEGGIDRDEVVYRAVVLSRLEGQVWFRPEMCGLLLYRRRD